MVKQPSNDSKRELSQAIIAGLVTFGKLPLTAINPLAILLTSAITVFKRKSQRKKPD